METVIEVILIFFLLAGGICGFALLVESLLTGTARRWRELVPCCLACIVGPALFGVIVAGAIYGLVTACLVVFGWVF